MLGFGLGNRRVAAAAFDPATLALSGYYQGSYAPNTWTGTASAGTSGSRSVTEPTNPPTSGTPVNGFAPAAFNGTNQKLTDSSNLSSYVTPTEGSHWELFRATSISGGAAAGYDNPALCCDIAGGNWGMHVGGASNDKFIAYLYDAIVGAKKAEFTIVTGTYYLGQMRWKGSTNTAEARLNGGAWTALSGAAFTSINGTLSSLYGMGRDYSQAKFFNGEKLGSGSRLVLMSDAEFDSIRSYVLAKFGLSV